MYSRSHQTTVGSEIFASLFLQIALKDISDVKKLRLRQYLPISINDRVILPFRKGFSFMKFRKNKVLAKFSNLQ